ncbi:MAG: efflux RND transporter periplasmic adaptor subunit [Deltaproteobacteria bacterium]|nr:efflux RND transporter periplasmic adaptor subunit [Deltaproteobacteria bacterium]
MKKQLPYILGVLMVALMVGTLWFLYSKSRPKPAVMQTQKPALADIVKKSVASGSLSPRKEVELKPKVAGILRKLFVKAGDKVKRGDMVGEVQIIVDPVGLNEGELRMKTAVLREARTKQELDRVTALVKKGTLPIAEGERVKSEHDLAVEEVATSQSRVQLLRAGSIRQTQGAPTRIESTVDGTVLSLPIKEGSSVINANSFNPGTTVAFVADMSDMIFKGTVDESEVGRLATGMPVEIVIGALNDLKFPGVLQFVAPKSIVKDATTVFEIEAAFTPPEGVVVRAGYSANANIVLDQRKAVLSIDEAYVTFEKGKPFVDVQKPNGTIEHRAVELGLSDGLRTEVKAGVTKDDVLRKPAAAS